MIYTTDGNAPFSQKEHFVNFKEILRCQGIETRNKSERYFFRHLQSAWL